MVLNGSPFSTASATNSLPCDPWRHVFLREVLRFGRPKTIEAELYRARPIEGCDLI